jgi:hypothetical protein
MVLAEPSYLKGKVYSLMSFSESNRLNMWMDFEDVRESAAQRITSAWPNSDSPQRVSRSKAPLG